MDDLDLNIFVNKLPLVYCQVNTGGHYWLNRF